jgi:hypothetical protein
LITWRLLVFGLLGLASAAGTAMGVLGAALRTGGGRDVVVRFGLEELNRNLDGSVSVGEVRGSYTGGLDVRDLVLRDTAGVEVVRIARAQIGYRAWDLLAGRMVLGELQLTGPRVTLVQDARGRLNLKHVLRLDRPGGGGHPPLIAFRNVVITDGSVRIGATHQITGLNARLTYARLSSPLPFERPMRFDITQLEAKVSNPEIDLRGARGRVGVLGDSLALNLDEARLPGSAMRVRGAITWPRDTLLYALTVGSLRFTTGDLQWIMRELPAGLTGRGDAVVHSRSGDVMELRLTNLDLTGAGGGGRLSGTLGLVLGPGKHRTVDHTELTTNDFDLEYVRPLLDTLPIAGRLSGTFHGDGPEERLAAEVNWTFRDSLVPGWPVSHVEGGGQIALHVPGDFVFADFAVRNAKLDMGTVRRLVPLDLRGELDAIGTLNGPWKQAEFSGTLRHHDGPRPPSLVRGVLKVDSRRDTLGLWANLSLDSLSLDGMRSSYPVLRVGGALSGDVKLSGYLDSLALSARLAGPAGRGTVEGALLFLGSRRGARWLDARFTDLDLHRLNDTLPGTSLDGRLRGDAVLDSMAAPQANGQLALTASRIAGSPLDSLVSRFTLADSVFRVDTLALYAPGFVASARGGLGIGGSHEDTLRILARSDSVGVVAPLARWLASTNEATDSAPSGAATVEADLVGSFSRFGLLARGRAPALRWGPLALRGGNVSGRWQSQDRGVVELDAEADSLSWGRMRQAAVEARVRGRQDSLGWFARSRWGENAAWLAGGTLREDSTATQVVVDSLGMLLPSEAWFLTRGARITIQDSAVVLDSAALTSASGGARVTLGGRLPRLGPGNLRLSLERLPLADVWALTQEDPDEVTGVVSGTMTLSGSAREPLIAGKAAFQDAAFRGFHAPYLDGTFTYSGRRLGGEFALWRTGQRVLGITADLPLDLALRNAPPDRQLPGPLSIRVRADSVDLGFLEAMVPVVRETGGRLSADFGIAGTWHQPALTGTLAVDEGAATLPALGVRHEHLFGRVTLSGDTIRVDTLRLQSGGGTATIGGFVRLAELTRPLLNLRIRGRDFRMMAVRDYLDFSASGEVTLQGPFYGATLTGRGTVPGGILYFTDLITKQVMNLEDVRYADIIDTSLVRRQGLREEFQNRFLDSLRIDSLSLTMGSDVWLRSAEANIQLTGGLVVNKVADRYRLDGTLETPRGTYRLPLTTAVKSDFAVTRGQLQYFGTADLNAAVDIDARHVVRRPDQNVNVDVHIGGTLYTPSLALSSDIRPPISQSEIISYLLFGTSSYQAVGANARNAQVIGSTFVSRWLAAQVSGQVERSLITDLGVPLDFVQIRPGDVNVLGARSGFLSGTEIAVGKQFTVLGLPGYLAPSLRICEQQTWSVKNLGVSAELRLSQPFRLALSSDPVGPCTGLLGPSGTVTHYQFGVDLFWDRIY